MKYTDDAYDDAQVVNVHNETVDSYLEDVILSAVQSTADKQVCHYSLMIILYYYCILTIQ